MRRGSVAGALRAWAKLEPSRFVGHRVTGESAGADRFAQTVA